MFYYCQTSVLFLHKGATLVDNRAHGLYTLAGSQACWPVLKPPSCLYLDNCLYISLITHMKHGLRCFQNLSASPKILINSTIYFAEDENNFR